MADQELTQKPYSTRFAHLADMKDWLGKEIGLTGWTTINQQQINTFAKITEDEQWIHVDPERAKKESPYKVPVAHGFMVLSLASKFAYETYQIDDVVMGLNYGMDKVRFPNATIVDSKIRGRVSLMSFEEKRGGARYKMKMIFEIQGQEKPACVAEIIAQVYIG